MCCNCVRLVNNCKWKNEWKRERKHGTGEHWEHNVDMCMSVLSMHLQQTSESTTTTAEIKGSKNKQLNNTRKSVTWMFYSSHFSVYLSSEMQTEIFCIGIKTVDRIVAKKAQNILRVDTDKQNKLQTMLKQRIIITSHHHSHRFCRRRHRRCCFGIAFMHLNWMWHDQLIQHDSMWIECVWQSVRKRNIQTRSKINVKCTACWAKHNPMCFSALYPLSKRIKRENMHRNTTSTFYLSTSHCWYLVW